MTEVASSPTTLYTPLAHMGGMAFTCINILADHWINCWDNQLPLLDIGCGNCSNTKKALESGAQVIATEMDKGAVESHQQTYQDVNNLSFHHVKLPQQVPFHDCSFSGILCSEVFHFLTHADVIATVWELHRILKPGGKAVITCACEDTLALQPGGIKEHQKQLRAHSPLKLGLIPDYLDYIRRIMEANPDNKLIADIYIQKQHALPTPYFNCYNPEQLAMVFTRLGFDIELLETGPADHYPLWEHGENDQIRLIAVKK